MEATVCLRVLVPVCQNTQQPTLEDVINIFYKHYNNVHSIEIGIMKCGNMKCFCVSDFWYF